MHDRRHYLELAIEEAAAALAEGNYPIGSLIVNEQGTILSQKRNQCSTDNDVTAHAEILNLREIGRATEEHLTMYSSLEPCFGCSFFIARSPIVTICSALKDPHKGGISDLKNQSQFAHFFQDIEIINEPFEDLKEQSRELMKQYFLRIGKPQKATFYGYKSLS